MGDHLCRTLYKWSSLVHHSETSSNSADNRPIINVGRRVWSASRCNSGRLKLLRRTGQRPTDGNRLLGYVFKECKSAGSGRWTRHWTRYTAGQWCSPWSSGMPASRRQTTTDTLSLSSQVPTHVNAFELMTMPVNHHVRRKNLMLQLSTYGFLETCIMCTMRNGRNLP